MRLFLKFNGYDLVALLEDKYKTTIRVAASEIIEDNLSQWIRKTGGNKKLNLRNSVLSQKFGGSDKQKIWVVLNHYTKQRVYRLYKCAIRFTLFSESEIS